MTSVLMKAERAPNISPRADYYVNQPLNISASLCRALCAGLGTCWVTALARGGSHPAGLAAGGPWATMEPFPWRVQGLADTNLDKQGTYRPF